MSLMPKRLATSAKNFTLFHARLHKIGRLVHIKHEIARAGLFSQLSRYIDSIQDTTHLCVGKDLFLTVIYSIHRH